MADAVKQIHLRHEATNIDIHRRIVEFNHGESEVSYDRMISTIPLPELVRIVPDAPEEVRAAANRLRCNSIFLVNLGIDRPSISPAHWIHFPEPDLSFFRISFPENLGPNLVPPGKSAVSAEVAYSAENPLQKETIVDQVIKDLKRAGVLRETDRIELTDTIDIPYAYVIYDHHRRDAVRVVRNWLKTVDIHTTGRYGLWAYLWSHEAILSGRQTALQLAGTPDELCLFPE
jgi:UDP-galactopyranose mutase